MEGIIVMQEPLITWNLVVCSIGLPVLGWWLGNLIKSRDKLQAENLSIWQEGARERNRSICEKIDKLDRCMAAIKEDLSGKVDLHSCDRNHDQVWDAIEKVRDKLII